jgi:hypothetical protein
MSGIKYGSFLNRTAYGIPTGMVMILGFLLFKTRTKTLLGTVTTVPTFISVPKPYLRSEVPYLVFFAVYQFIIKRKAA